MKKFLSLVLALVMTMSLVTVSAGAEDFTDDSSITYEEAVDVMSAVGIIDGYTDGSFQPTTLLTRGAAAKIICNLILGPTTAAALGADTAPYSDVPTTNVFAGYIAYCQKEGIISGYADGTFKPANPLTGYAFMKMLLGALGYDSAKEGYTGANWSVNVAKQAIAIGLDDGNDEFVGQASVNREEAMLYAFNAMNATMVEYANDTTIVVGDVTVSSSGKASEVANTASNEGIKNDDKMQFAEKYFSDLKKSSGTDAFERPATVWKLKTTEIGTYADEADATYTAEVNVGTIYNDLGLTSGIASSKVSIYVDGSAVSAVAISKGDTTNKLGGNGALTQVYYDDEAGTVIITVVNTYLGKITATYAASSTKDAYVAFDAKTGAGATYETEETFNVDDYVLYTYSNKTGEGVQSMAPAESVTGTLTAYTIGKSVTVGGTAYSSNCVQASKDTIDSTLANAMKTDVVVYLDSYGYAIYVDAEAASDNYAVVMGYTGTSTVGVNASRTATLLFADGTTKSVTVSNDTVFAGSANDATLTNPAINTGDIVSYRINSDNEYKLSVLADTVQQGATSGTNSDGVIITKGTSTISLTANKVGSPVTANTANGKTNFVFYNANTNAYSSYTGIANVPTVDLTGNSKVTVYCKTGTIATFVYVETANATVSSSSKDVIFVLGNNSGASHSSDLNDYYSYDAIINGEITTINTSNDVTTFTLATDVTKDSKGVYDLSNAKKVNSVTTSADSGKLFYTTGTDKVNNGTIQLGSAYYSVADDCQVFRVSADGKSVSVSSVAAISKDQGTYADKVWGKVTDGELTTIVIQTVDDTTGTIPGTDPNYTVTGVSASASTGVTVTLANYGVSNVPATVSVKVSAMIPNLGTDYTALGTQTSFSGSGNSVTVSNAKLTSGTNAMLKVEVYNGSALMSTYTALVSFGA